MALGSNVDSSSHKVHRRIGLASNIMGMSNILLQPKLGPGLATELRL